MERAEKFKEIIRLRDMLIEAKIPHEFREWQDGYQIRYPNPEKRVCSVIEFTGSYGGVCDLLEIMGLLTEEEKQCDTVCGGLTAVDVFCRILAHYRGKECVVFCKDCRYNVANQTHDENDLTDYSDITCSYFMTDGMSGEDFCSKGVKKA